MLLLPLLLLPPFRACVTVSWMLQVIGTIDGSGRVRLVDKLAEPGTPTPVDLNLDQVRNVRFELLSSIKTIPCK
jgi:phosphoribosylformylglycinamidine synthase